MREPATAAAVAAAIRRLRLWCFNYKVAFSDLEKKLPYNASLYFLLLFG
jgi:hypothetical protein